MSILTSLFRPIPLFTIAALLRLTLLLYGTYQDAHSALKYTDIDYLVFTDAARSVHAGASPYDRDTYRYTPLLAWILVPTAWGVPGFFSFGKVLFAAADLGAGWLILRILELRPDFAPLSPRSQSSLSTGSRKETVTSSVLTAEERAGAFAALWLWNPMVATISTRGSSEGLLALLTTALLYAVLTKRVTLSAIVLGVSVHFKIYPFIYAFAIIWWMDPERMGSAGVRGSSKGKDAAVEVVMRFLTLERIQLVVVSLVTFMALNGIMFAMYGKPFIIHTYLHHVTRVDHRHNFSPYNMLLYLNSATPSTASTSSISRASMHVESLAFLPQLLLSCVLIPLVLAKRDLATSMMAQTFAFVTFNKVCTSQYFLWYMIFLPLYLPSSNLLKPSGRITGIVALALWVVAQAAWLYQGYRLEFLGESSFFPGLWLASLGFFLANCWILGVFIEDGVSIDVEKSVKLS